jgi:hypothetical protein
MALQPEDDNETVRSCSTEYDPEVEVFIGLGSFKRDEKSSGTLLSLQLMLTVSKYEVSG